MRDCDSKGKVKGLFEEMCKLALELDSSINPSSMDLKTGFYVTESDTVIWIHGTTIFRLIRDLDDQPCWTIDADLLDNWYEGPYFDMVPLSGRIVEEMGLRGLKERKYWELEPEKEFVDDAFLKLRARLEGEDARYVDSLLDGAQEEIAAHRAAHPELKHEQNTTGTLVGELDAIRRFGKTRLTGHSVFGEGHGYWLVAGHGELPCDCSLAIVLISYLDLGWIPELFLQELWHQELAWDVAAMREFLGFARRACNRDIPDLYYVEHMEGDEAEAFSRTSFLKDLETGMIWRWTSEWTPYYSDGIIVNRPYLSDEQAIKPHGAEGQRGMLESTPHRKGLDSAERACPLCGRVAFPSWLFCKHCGSPLSATKLESASPVATMRTIPCVVDPSELPAMPGVPGKIVGVKVSHGWAATCGYYDIHEVANGKAARARKIPSAQAGVRFPERWFDRHVVDFDCLNLEAVLQNVRYCDIGKRQGGTTVIEPRSDGLFMRITYEDADGTRRSFDVQADVEYGDDAASRAARDVVRSIERAFGSKRAIDCLLVIHRRGPFLRVVMNGPLYSMMDSCKDGIFSVVDCDTGDILMMEVNKPFDKMFLELRVFGLRDGWLSRKAMFPVEDGAVVRLSPASFIWEGWWDDAVACDPKPRGGDSELDEWIVVCANCKTHFLEQHIDEAPFLDGYKPLAKPGSYVLASWLEEGDGKNTCAGVSF